MSLDGAGETLFEHRRVAGLIELRVDMRFDSMPEIAV
jgi:hypothetical protein